MVIKRWTTDKEQFPSNLGSVLVTMGLLTQEQLEVAMARSGRLGDAVCELGFCTADDVSRAVAIQEQMRQGTTADAAMAMLTAATAGMRANTERIADSLKGARLKARASGEKTGVFLLRHAS